MPTGLATRPFAVGDIVEVSRRRNFDNPRRGVIVQLGCDHPGCPWDHGCIDVRPDDGQRENFGPDQVRLPAVGDGTV